MQFYYLYDVIYNHATLLYISYDVVLLIVFDFCRMIR